MIHQRGVLLVALKSFLRYSSLGGALHHQLLRECRRRFRAPCPRLSKIEDEGNSAPHNQGFNEQELMDMFRKGMLRRLELRKKQGQYNASGSANPLPLQQLPSPPPLPPPHALSPPPEHAWAKRLPVGPPPGLAGVRQPPQKQHQRKPPWQKAQQQARMPGPPPVNLQTAQHTENAHCAGGPPGPPPVNVSSVVPAARSKPPHPASKKKPSVACGVCGVLCLRDHEKGRKHRNRVACLAGQMNVRCQVCNVHLSGALNVEQHYAGKQHLLRLNRGA